MSSKWKSDGTCLQHSHSSSHKCIFAGCPSLVQSSQGGVNTVTLSIMETEDKAAFWMKLCTIYLKHHSRLLPTSQCSYTSWEWYLNIYCSLTATCKWNMEYHKLWWEINTSLLWQKRTAQFSALTLQRVEIDLSCFYAWCNWYWSCCEACCSLRICHSLCL